MLREAPERGLFLLVEEMSGKENHFRFELQSLLDTICKVDYTTNVKFTMQIIGYERRTNEDEDPSIEKREEAISS